MESLSLYSIVCSVRKKPQLSSLGLLSLQALQHPDIKPREPSSFVDQNPRYLREARKPCSFSAPLRHTPPLPVGLGTYLGCLESEMSKALGGFRAQSSFPKPSNLAADAPNSVLLLGEDKKTVGWVGRGETGVKAQ